ncbi:MAG: hypothetical protein AAFU71_05775 [Cyanobacteria bacterium J06632_22]
MGKRTAQTGLPDWSDAPDLDNLVRDKRLGKRANPAKGRRRHRRYENRLLSSQLTELEQSEASLHLDGDTRPWEQSPDGESAYEHPTPTD